MTPDPQVVQLAIRLSRRGGYVYLNNPKCACWAIKTTLWQGDRSRYLPPLNRPQEVHGRRQWDLDFEGAAEDRWFRFTATRNPFARILSAYLDKIERPGVVRDKFCLRYGLDRSVSIRFTDFLTVIQDSPAEDDDPHWRPQAVNTMHGAFPVDMIARLEEPETLDRAMQRAVSRPLEATRPHSTNANAAVAEYYGTRETELLLNRYAIDFEAFGYGPDPIDLAPVGPAESTRSADPDAVALIDALGAADPQTRIARLDAISSNASNAARLLAFAAEIANDMEDASQAVDLAKRALALDDRSAGAGWQLARAALALGDEDASLDASLRAVEQRPDLRQAWMNIAKLRLRRGQHDLARQAAGNAALLSAKRDDNAATRLLQRIPDTTSA
ncbi:MAG: sulfotransferase family 2 domain-containing protein [Planctomycetota bacterium]